MKAGRIKRATALFSRFMTTTTTLRATKTGTMTLDISSFLGIVPLEDRMPLTPNSFIRYLLPALLCYYITAVLVQLPHTKRIRIPLLPFSLWSAFSAATRINVVGIFKDARLLCWNQVYILVLFNIAIRDVTWTFQSVPFQRLCSTSTQVDAKTHIALKGRTFWQIAVDACDLFWNFRGVGWDWSRGLRVPVHTRPTYSRRAFLLATVRATVMTIFICDILHYSIQWFSPSTIGSAQGGTIFDPSLSPVRRYTRSTLITLLGSLMICYCLHIIYHTATIIGVLVFRQTPHQWPPIFTKVWLSTSIMEFWGMRWHQAFRDNLLQFGFKPFAYFFGRIGGMMGAFLVSGLMHFVAMWGAGKGGDFLLMMIFFFFMGVGTLLEHTFRKVTGKRVQGWWGRMWTIIWVAGWGHILAEAGCMKGLAGSVFLPPHIRPSFRLFGPLPLTDMLSKY